jgi:GT2 family glycosyltransferase
VIRLILTFGVIIPTKNRRDDLLRAVGSVLKQSRPADELIVVDQSSSESIRESVESLLAEHQPLPFSVRYLCNAQLNGLTAAKNFAIDNSTSEQLLFIDDDIILEPDFLLLLENAYRQNDLDGVGGIPLLPSEKSPWHYWASLAFRLGPFRDDRLRLSQLKSPPDGIYPTWLLSGGLSCYKRSVFDRIRFNEALTGASPIEDVDFCSRAIAKGLRFALVPKARALHNLSPATRLRLQDFYNAKAQVYALYFSKYVEKNLLNHLAYWWVNIGLLLDAVYRSLMERQLSPLIGVVAGWQSLAGGITDHDMMAAQ